MHLLAQHDAPTRCQIEGLLRRALRDFQARTRAVDIRAKAMGSRCWTLGFYVYGSKVGLTNRTLVMPHVVKLLNLYLKPLMSPEEQELATWTALRVSWGMQSEPHKDRNMRGTKSFLAPISRFEGGRLWVSNPQTAAGELAPDLPCDHVQWGDKWGKYVGGDRDPVWFDAGQLRAVEPRQMTVWR